MGAADRLDWRFVRPSAASNPTVRPSMTAEIAIDNCRFSDCLESKLPFEGGAALFVHSFPQIWAKMNGKGALPSSLESSQPLVSRSR